MSAQAAGAVTMILQELHAGDAEAQGRLLALVYDEIRGMAAGFMGGERAGHSWQPSDLAHEVLLRLLGSDLRTKNRREFFAAATRTMRRILIDYARHRAARVHGGGRQRLPLDEVALYFEQQKLDIEAVHEAVERLAGFDERRSQVVTLRYFGGYAVKEIAALLAISVSTVENDLRIALAWLHGQLAGGNS